MKNQLLILDGHVHLYPEYNLQSAFKIGIENMKSALRKSKLNSSTQPITVWLLTERWDCHFFRQISESAKKFSSNGLTIQPSPEKEAILFQENGRISHLILAGRQLVSNDGLEVLSLATDLFVEDRKFSTGELIQKVNESGGVPVLNWAPGKWFFNRGKIVREQIQNSKTNTFVVGDNPLRCTLWPTPQIMKEATNKGFKLIAGSDPLPFVGEENNIGTYCFATHAPFDMKKPVASIRQILRQKEFSADIIGKRNGLFTFFSRETRIMLKK